MSRPPSRVPPGEGQRLRNMADRTASMRGASKWPSAVTRRPVSTAMPAPPAPNTGPVYAYFYGAHGTAFSPGTPAGGNFSSLTQPLGVATFGAIVGTDNHAEITLPGWYSMSITAQCASVTSGGAVKIEAATTADTYCIGYAVGDGSSSTQVHAMSPPFEIDSGDEPVDVSGVLTGVTSSGTLTWMDLRVFRLADA